MKAEVESAGFENILKFIGVVSGQMDLRSGQNILMTAHPSVGGVAFEAANKGMYARVTLPGSVETEGKVVVNQDYISRLRLAGKVTKFTTGKKGRLKFSSGRTRGELEVGDDAGVVEQQRPSGDTVFTAQALIPSAPFTKMLKMVLFTAGLGAKLNVRIIVNEGGIYIAASDEFRAARARYSAAIDGSFDVTLPAEFLEKMLPYVAKASENMYLMANESICRFTDAGGMIDIWHPVRVRSGVADVDAFVSTLTASTGTFEIDPEEAANAVKTVEKISGGSKNEPRLQMSVGANAADIKVESNIGKCEDGFDVTWIEGQGADVKMDMITWHIGEFLSRLKTEFKKSTMTIYKQCAVLRGVHESVDVMYVLPRIGSI